MNTSTSGSRTCPKIVFIRLLVLLIALCPSLALGQFVSGSNGANGPFPPIAPPAGTTAIRLDLRDGVVTFLPDGTAVALPNVPAGGFADGIVHFTTMDVPQGVSLSFVRNEANTPVTILTLGDVTVAGTIGVSGENGSAGPNGRGGFGGPGGFKGGSGEQVLNSPGAGSGLGPGGGRGAVVGAFRSSGGGGGGGGFGTGGGAGTHETGGGGSPYGTPPLLPLIGGSGGGGGATVTNGGPIAGGGGGGGGAILIASSTEINVSGSIFARGGRGGNGQQNLVVGGFSVSTGAGGGGSGGAIRLIANTLSGSGTVDVAGGSGGTTGSGGGGGASGRIRLEAFIDNFAASGTANGVVTSSGPGIVFLPNPPSVKIASVGGQPVPDPPTGGIGGTDVVVDAPGTVSVELRASRVPLGTTIAVTAKPETDGAVIGPVTSTALAGTLDDSTATVDLEFPSAGLFFLEARATFTTP